MPSKWVLPDYKAQEDSVSNNSIPEWAKDWNSVQREGVAWAEGKRGPLNPDVKPIQLDGPCGYVVSAYRVDGEACVLLRSSSRVVREMFVDEALRLATLLQIAAGYARNGKMPHDI